MITSPSPSPSPNPTLPNEDVYNYYRNYFHNNLDDHQASDPLLPNFPPRPPSPLQQQQRQQQDLEQEEEDNMPKKNPKSEKPKKRSLAKIITSLAALESEEQSHRRESIGAANNHLSLLQENYAQQYETMLGYRSNITSSHFDDFDDSLLVETSSHLATAAAAVAAASAAAAEAEDSAATVVPGHVRRLWVKDRSRDWWDQLNHPDFPEEEFKKAFRMGKATFDLICRELDSAVVKEDTMLRAAIPVRQRVAVCIWRLATGEPLRLVSKKFGLGISTCHKLVLEVCSAIKKVMMPKFLQWPETAEEEEVMKLDFAALSGIPNVVGSLYTTHIPIIAPKVSVAAYFNKRHTERNQKTSYSITVQGVVSPSGIFTDVCIGYPGAMPDDQVLMLSALSKRAKAGLFQNSWVVGGIGYPLMDWVLVPYTQQNLTWTQHAFNEKIAEVQRIAKEAFGRLKGRWSCLQKRTEVKLQDLPIVLGACCVLHNICEMRNEEMNAELRYEVVDDEMVPSQGQIQSMASMQARDNIAHNLLHHGLAGTNFFN